MPNDVKQSEQHEWYIGKHESGNFLIHTDPTAFAPSWALREDTIAAFRGSHPKAEEYAALACRAVNERERLLEALRAARGCIDPNLSYAEDVEAQIEAALAGSAEPMSTEGR